MVRAWAGFDLLVTGALALPPVARPLLGLLAALGGASAPALPELGWLFVHVAGALGVLWAVVRLARPTRFLGLADAVARLWVGGLIARFVLAGGVPAVYLAFVASEWLGAAAQLGVLGRRGA
jgi:hypothetical protein